MAKSNAVWGIDIGQCALKALQCRPHEKDSNQIVVESFDYIEYPKILSQPEADPEELVREALEQFLERNDLTGDSVAISVAGQSGLARFIKLPPVESKKIPDIVKYEARQQIPFALEDVVWDYQQLSGGSEEDGFALEPEVGLFAMKRDQVARALKPLEDAGIEVDFIQLMPLAIYNYVCFDRLEDLQSQPYDPNDPPESTVVISLGTDTTDLVVTNGYRVWQRNIPIGGNHFTRALSKELKLTFVKAEHLKRNATQADDPKAVFQAMRPVFSDLLAEIQRSLGYFSSIDKAAKIGGMVALGNAMKLPGLQRYLAQNLEQEVTLIEDYEHLSAGSTTSQSQFKQNILSFAVSYGLCLQSLGKSEIQTNLLPEEIVRSRLVRAKKPWAVAGVAALLMGMTFNYAMHVSAWQDTATDDMTRAESDLKNVQTMSSGYKSTSSDIHNAFNQIRDTGEKLVSNVEGRLLWLELMKAIEVAIPSDERPFEQREGTVEDISNRVELHIESIDQQHFEDLGGDWFSSVEAVYLDKKGDAEAGDDELAEEDIDEDFGEGDLGGGEGGGDLSGPGWVVQLTGYHYHNKDRTNQTSRFVKNTLIKNLEEGFVVLPDGPDGGDVQVPFADLGISHAWIVKDSKIKKEMIDLDNPLGGDLASGRGGGGYGGEFGGGYGGEGGYGMRRPTTTGDDGEEQPSSIVELDRYDFVVQFVWKETPKSARQEIAEQRRLEEEAARADTAAIDEQDGTEVR
ncbi:MAG: type IV pilus assembly protein PilM [Planctomycetota bacterium]